jgi:hypothetical protein
VIVVFTVARPPAMDGLASTVYCDMLKLLGMWCTVGKWPTPTRVISAGRRPCGYGEPTNDRVRAYPVSRSLPPPPPRQSPHQRARIVAPVRITAARGDASEDLFQPTVPSELHSERLIEEIEKLHSPLFMWRAIDPSAPKL